MQELLPEGDSTSQSNVWGRDTNPEKLGDVWAFSALSPHPLPLLPHPMYLGQEFQPSLGREGLGYRRAEHQSGQPLGACGAHLPAPASAGETGKPAKEQGSLLVFSVLPPESLVFNKMTSWLRTSAGQVHMGWWPDTDFLCLAQKGVGCNGVHSPFLSLQKNVTLQCVFWVEDLTRECGGVSELGGYLEEKRGPGEWGRWG